MDIIYECAANFQKLLDIKYHFVVSSKRKVKDITIDFREADFRHAAGLHYVDDIDIERNPDKVISAIIKKTITDELLSKSKKYQAVNSDGDSVKDRVSAFRNLEKFLDTSDFIRIYELQEFGSFIKADYFIEAKYNKSTAYIFIRKRTEDDTYVVVTFFQKKRSFRGTGIYWMLKEKISNGSATELYRHPNYKLED
ncbi:MAG: hypothetical protein E7302_02685 [Butyrivibrio sp.]|nr:hypothetical protein [Butyrivibrio sp.]